MSAAPGWDIAETRQAIIDLYGHDQMFLARESLHSVIDRRTYAHFHFHEAMRRWDKHLRDVGEDQPTKALFGTGDETTDGEWSKRMSELGAHVQACVHSLHSIPDIMAHGLYYGLCLNKPTALPERKITAAAVKRLLDADPSLHGLRDLFHSMFSGGDFKYISALSNHGKHRSIVPTAIWADFTGTAVTPIRLQFYDFTYDGNKHAGRDIRPVLTSEYDRLAVSIIDCGIELGNILKWRKKVKGGASPV